MNPTARIIGTLLLLVMGGVIVYQIRNMFKTGNAKFPLFGSLKFTAKRNENLPKFRMLIIIDILFALFFGIAAFAAAFGVLK